MALKKTLLGQKIRLLRQERKLSQQLLAERLGISPSYLNLIEHDERPVTVTLLIKLGQVLGLDLQALSDEADRRLAAALGEVFADAGLAAGAVEAAEIGRLVATAPSAARAVVELYRAWRLARDDAQSLQLDLPGDRTRRIVLPNEEARDFFESHANHFPAIEAAAEALGEDGAAGTEEGLDRLAARLAQRHGITLQMAPVGRMNGALRRFDPATRRLALSEVLPPASRRFHLAYQLGLVEARDEIARIIAAAPLSTADGKTLCRVGLANYFAAAALMPYRPFLAAARDTRYDIELLMHRFGVSFEQAAQRLTTLQRPGDTGIPFFFARADIAGNIVKRFSAAGFHFSRFGGSCARFILHEIFATPGRIRTQVARLPDGTTFFTLARTVERPGGGFHAPQSHHAIGLGCDIARAPELVYADGLDLDRVAAMTEIGVGCRLCERADCRQRAFPPLQHRLIVDEMVKGASTYAFSNRG